MDLVPFSWFNALLTSIAAISLVLVVLLWNEAHLDLVVPIVQIVHELVVSFLNTCQL